MRTLLSALVATVLISCSGGTPAATTPSAPRSGYDAQRAQRLGADDYGMKRYVLALLRRGPNQPADKKQAAALMRAHLNNIKRLATAGKLLIAGPFLDKGELRGIYIFNVASVDEARKLTESDPAIEAGALIMELHPWYGSAALQEVKTIHPTIQNKSI